MSRRTTAWSRQRAARRRRHVVLSLAVLGVVAWQAPAMAAAVHDGVEQVVAEGRGETAQATAIRVGRGLERHGHQDASVGPLTVVDAHVGRGCVVEETGDAVVCGAVLTVDQVSTAGVVVTARLNGDAFVYASPTLR